MHLWSVNGIRIKFPKDKTNHKPGVVARVMQAIEIPHKQRIQINLPPKR